MNGVAQTLVHVVEMGQTSGTFRFTYEIYGIPDHIIIWYEGSKLWELPCVGTQGERAAWISYAGTRSVITVEVNPNCDPYNRGDTEWYFTVECPY
jgi:hypothetical protein